MDRAGDDEWEGGDGNEEGDGEEQGLESENEDNGEEKEEEGDDALQERMNATYSSTLRTKIFRLMTSTLGQGLAVRERPVDASVHVLYSSSLPGPIHPAFPQRQQHPRQVGGAAKW